MRVRRAGSKQFVQIVRIDGKRYERSLGGWPKVGLAEARDIAHENCRKVRHGENPFARQAANDATTFEDAPEAVLAMQSANWRGTRTEANWRSSMEACAMPKLGGMDVAAIATPDVLACLRPIWNDKRPTAQKVRRRISAVMDWAIASGHRKDNPAAAVDAVLPGNGTTTTHLASLPCADVPAFLAAAKDSKAHPGTKLALQFLVLTAARSGEARKATWAEIDRRQLNDSLWVVPAKHMKANAEHVVPLSVRAAWLLREAAKRYGGEGIVFPAPRGKALVKSTKRLASLALFGQR